MINKSTVEEEERRKHNCVPSNIEDHCVDKKREKIDILAGDLP
jgi:hypothetical protein